MKTEIKMVFTLFDLEDEKIVKMDLSELLKEINRDRSGEWSDYTAEDWKEGWEEWCEGDIYKLLKVEVTK